MVAAAVIGGAAISGGSSLLGGLTASNSAAASAAAQQRMLNQVLQYQQGLLTGAEPIAQQIQQQGSDFVSGGLGNAVSVLDAAGGQAINALTGYAPQAISAIQGGVNQGLGLLGDAESYLGQWLGPYVNAGMGAANTLASEIGSGQLGAMPNINDPTQLPGYQFALTQGEQAARNQGSAQGYSATGSNISGPLGKSLAQYAEGLANTNYSQYLSNYWANQNNRYGILSGLAGLGANAGAAMGSNLTNIGNTAGNIAATGGSNIGNVYNALGGNVASQYGAIGSGIANANINAMSPYLTSLNWPAATLASLAGGTSSNVGTAGIQGSQNVANSNQAAGNLLGSSFSNLGTTFNNALNNPFILNSLMGNGTTVYPQLASQYGGTVATNFLGTPIGADFGGGTTG